ncbi:2Fe-2S iron-sulfur cluster-binding protein [Paenibacillus sp. GCM10027626]|uniref:2Fe-2S iron-sulfur cluster-binding protein n=1 Tax=Paenibacillus sp. GCM10027626 TaxID=3273411 RepID=UPI00363D194E
MRVQITFQPANKTITVRSGTTVLDASRKAGIAIRTRCGGKAACLMCKVRHAGDKGLSAVNEAERRKLAGLADEGMRLSCQARIVGPVTVEVPEDPLRAAIRKQLQQTESDDLWGD